MTADTRREALKNLVSTDGISFAATPILIGPAPYFDLAGEEFGSRLILTIGADGSEFCLRPDFTLPIAIEHLKSGASTPAAYGYLGPIFRQRTDGPAEFDQAGLELLALPDSDAALDRVIGFARAALDIYGIASPAIRVGSIDLFEAFLASCDMPDVWRPRIRARFGHPRAMTRLLDRLADPHKPMEGPKGIPQQGIADWVSELMLTNGLSLTESRGPDEIARRYLEKQALEAAHVPSHTIDLLRTYLAISGDTDQALSAIAELAERGGFALSGAIEDAAASVAQLRNSGRLSGLVFDAGFSPRLDYYTGITFEMTGKDGAVLVSGGQYDRLLKRLGAETEIPAVGCAVWVERLEASCGAGEAGQ
ncbi:ATP phosphoribosyltransferase regulatory subunit [Pelagibacterium lentulum]|uniref:ATP phosphoribosyltransferase regulatory subunit n=1 Tax=Pelagibacterium lentulum TaxID=2029865 RepID=A0A916RGT1_9HYPH|nr:ATP phosphoribosyltransferase regulatory subunit [Pelagibacterium lentulum]GGA56555.1 ATP phosphoribosyltransferase regulatory subunit [Pelagibacterium lentulum]